jgi:hypothetical protein
MLIQFDNPLQEISGRVLIDMFHRLLPGTFLPIPVGLFSQQRSVSTAAAARVPHARRVQVDPPRLPALISSTLDTQARWGLQDFHQPTSPNAGADANEIAGVAA